MNREKRGAMVLEMGRSTKILVALVVLGVAVFGAYNQIGRQRERGLRTSLEQERNELWDNIGRLEEKVATLEEELAQHKEAPVPEEKLIEVFGQEPTAVSPEVQETSCEELARHIAAFFTYLDKKGYVTSHGLEGGTYDVFQHMLSQLSETPPVVTAETKDLYSLTRNVVHFYRVLGIKRIELIVDILKTESEVIEPAMATLFTWFTSADRCKEEIPGAPSLEVQYEYAGFFLNTLAGKSYLLRRDSRVRILTSYYSVLILDRANEETLNRHGIDIRPYIDFSFYDISNQKGLVYQKQYMGTLDSLRKKYHQN